ncbi:MAG TPA: hypothetical protein VG076_11385 [Acidimicrobiales bacterium]|jgi:hypothetical protein|nr:hypothetical protein [Acidimicrobiales bacterium]
MAQASSSKSRTGPASKADIALGAAQEAVRASIEAAQKVADCSMEAGSEATQRVQASLKEALEALRAPSGAAAKTPSRKSA